MEPWTIAAIRRWPRSMYSRVCEQRGFGDPQYLPVWNASDIKTEHELPETYCTSVATNVTSCRLLRAADGSSLSVTCASLTANRSGEAAQTAAVNFWAARQRYADTHECSLERHEHISPVPAPFRPQTEPVRYTARVQHSQCGWRATRKGTRKARNGD